MTSFLCGGGSSGDLASAFDAPDLFEATVADDVQVVMQVHGRVAVAGNEAFGPRGPALDLGEQ